MTHQIKKSQVALIPDFENQVALHVTEMQFWHDRKKIVAEEEKIPLGPRPMWSDYKGHDDPMAAYGAAVVQWEADSLKRHALVKRPNPHPLIDACVRQDGETFIADYKIENDDPTLDQILRVKKNMLLEKIALAEDAAQQAALPPLGKRRLLDLNEVDIIKGDRQRNDDFAAEIMKQHTAGTLTDKETAQKLHGWNPEAGRPLEHTQHLADQASRRSKVDAIARAGAQAMSDVEDLTADNFDAFEIPSFGN